jgi:hypothetical protein
MVSDRSKGITREQEKEEKGRNGEREKERKKPVGKNSRVGGMASAASAIAFFWPAREPPRRWLKTTFGLVGFLSANIFRSF